MNTDLDQIAGSLGIRRKRIDRLHQRRPNVVRFQIDDVISSSRRSMA